MMQVGLLWRVLTPCCIACQLDCHFKSVWRITNCVPSWRTSTHEAKWWTKNRWHGKRLSNFSGQSSRLSLITSWPFLDWSDTGDRVELIASSWAAVVMVVAMMVAVVVVVQDSVPVEEDLEIDESRHCPEEVASIHHPVLLVVVAGAVLNSSSQFAFWINKKFVVLYLHLW